MEQVHRTDLTREAAEWGVIVPERDPQETACVRLAVRRYPTNREYPVLMQVVPNAVPV